MISIYSSAFNLIDNKFDFEFSIKNFTNFADEVVIAVNTSKDSTLQQLKELQSLYTNLKIIECNYLYSDPLLDGKIKNFALQNTTMDIKISLDMDEYIPQWQKPIWEKLSTDLLNDTFASCYMIPNINLYKDKHHYSSIASKWYLHKKGLKRGAVNFAKKLDGTIDTYKSDSCELLDINDNLVPCRYINADIDQLRSNLYPFVVHTGYKNLPDRITRNNNFWKNHWLVESGGIAPPHKVHSNIHEFTEQGKQHGLNI
jgi:hypothetical protein